MNLIHEIKVYLSVVTIPSFVRLWAAMRGPMQSSFAIHVSAQFEGRKTGPMQGRQLVTHFLPHDNGGFPSLFDSYRRGDRDGEYVHRIELRCWGIYVSIKSETKHPTFDLTNSTKLKTILTRNSTY